MCSSIDDGEYGVSLKEKISHMVTPNAQISDSIENRKVFRASMESHFTGNAGHFSFGWRETDA
jgi:hypothetical protein